MIKFNFWKKASDKYEFWIWIKDKWKKDKNFLDKYFDNENAKEWFFKKRQMQLEDLDTINKLKKDLLKKYQEESKKEKYIKEKNRKILKKWFNNFIQDKKTTDFLNKVSIFWNSEKDFKKNINIILYKKYTKTTSGLAASAIKGIEAKVINISFNEEIDVNNKSQKITFLSTFMHELSHIIQYHDNNNLVNLFKEEFKKRKIDIRKQDDYWDSILEGINSSIAHFNLSLFLEEFYSIKDLRVYEKDMWKIQEPNSKIKTDLYLPIAYRILPETRKYFKEEKKIDEKYIEKVFDIYENFIDNVKN